MQAMSLERTSRTEAIQAALNQCREQGIATFTQIEQATGVSRSAISQLANHGVALHAAKLNSIEGYLRANAPHTLDMVDEDPEEPVQMSMLSRQETVNVYPTEDMQKLIGWLNTLYKHRAIGALVGPAGSGKTTILREYCKANPNARYMKCWALMHMGDLLDMIADTFSLSLRGTMFRRQQQLMDALRGTDAMLLLDEAEFLKTWNIKKLEVLREIWDAIGIPIVLCGTDGLKDVLTRGTGRDNCAQLYRRCWQGVTSGISAAEMDAILGEYEMSPDAAKTLTQMAVDHKHGGMGNAFETLRIALEITGGAIITTPIIKQAMQYKVLFK
jgi:DNA transposition AAA+ family ATPase